KDPTQLLNHERHRRLVAVYLTHHHVRQRVLFTFTNGDRAAELDARLSNRDAIDMRAFGLVRGANLVPDDLTDALHLVEHLSGSSVGLRDGEVTVVEVCFNRLEVLWRQRLILYLVRPRHAVLPLVLADLPANRFERRL